MAVNLSSNDKLKRVVGRGEVCLVGSCLWETGSTHAYLCSACTWGHAVWSADLFPSD